jgi:hypothetical protein
VAGALTSRRRRDVRFVRDPCKMGDCLSLGSNGTSPPNLTNTTVPENFKAYKAACYRAEVEGPGNGERTNPSLDVPSNHTPRVVRYPRFPPQRVRRAATVRGVVHKDIALNDPEPKAGPQSGGDVRSK